MALSMVDGNKMAWLLDTFREWNDVWVWVAIMLLINKARNYQYDKAEGG